MKAAYINEVGSPDNIVFGDLPDPAIGDEDVFVKVTAVAVDPIDTYIRSGAYKLDLPKPFIIGRDMTGTVVTVGSKVSNFKAGDKVWSNNQGYGGRQGTFAELLSINHNYLYHLPSACDPVQSVAVLHSALTAVTGLFHRADVHPGHKVFVNGGSGNVGTAVMQLCKAVGAKVAATAGDQDKSTWCLQQGADFVINYKTDNVENKLVEFAPSGLDVYWDATGRIDLASAVSLMANKGQLVVMSGINHQSNLPVGEFYRRNLTMHGFTITQLTVDELSQYASDINRYLETGVLKARVDQTMPLSQAAHAHRLMEGGEPFGKLVLVV